MKRDSNLLLAVSILALALFTQGGCAGTSTVINPAAQPASSQDDSAKPVLAGKVVETMNAGGYTYVLLEKGGKSSWSAVPTMEVKVGDELELYPGAEMGPFTSKALNRTFDKIIFSGGPIAKSAEKPAALPSGHPTIPATPLAKESAKPATNSKPVFDKAVVTENLFYSGKVAETINSGGYTYICLEKDGKKSWAAVPPTDVKVGEDIELLPGTEMGAFKSKTLNRTFDNIIFSAGVAPKKK